MSNDHAVTEVLFVRDDEDPRCATCERPVEMTSPPQYQYIGPDEKGTPVYRLVSAVVEHARA